MVFSVVEVVVGIEEWAAARVEEKEGVGVERKGVGVEEKENLGVKERNVQRLK